MDRARIVIRCDGSLSIGMGHVMRMLALARALRDRAIDVEFVTASEFALGAIQNHGFAHTLVSPGIDGVQHAELVRRRGALGVIVDAYACDAAYFRSLYDSDVLTGVVDDLADRDLRSADWIVNPTPGMNAVSYPGHQPDALFLGPQYALLREEFIEMRSTREREAKRADTHVLITLGGGDVAERLGALETALRASRPDLDLRTASSASNMAQLMAWADVAVTAAGHTAWELCCMGVPMIALTIAENQVNNARALAQAGCTISLGSWNASTPADAATAAVRLLNEPSERSRMSQAGRMLVDGMGASRLTSRIMERWQ
ncbi:MAG: PseG/SpsG family protein [Vulcanimicrobiaceae bacterium]